MGVTSFRRSILLLPLWGLLQSGAAAAPETGAPLGDLDIELHVVRREPEAYQISMDKAGATVTLDKSALKTDTVTVQGGSKIEDLLRSRSIDPDGEALSAVYVLNPDVRDVNALESGDSLVLPAVPREKIGPGHLVQLTLVPETKRDLESHARAINALAEQLEQLPAEQVGTPAERNEVSEALSTIRGYLEDVTALVEERELPLSPEMLVQSLDGARLVREILERSPETPWYATDRQAILGISQDMALKARNLDEVRGPGKSPMRWRDVRVVVSVVQLPGQKPVSDLRVFYAPEALVDKPFAIHSFPGFSPQVAKRLIEADYVFWAAPPGSSQPSTEQLKQKIRRTQDGEIKIQIAVQPSPKVIR